MMTSPTALPFMVWGTQSALVRFLRASGWENSTSGARSSFMPGGAETLRTFTSMIAWDAPAGTKTRISKSNPCMRTLPSGITEAHPALEPFVGRQGGREERGEDRAGAIRRRRPRIERVAPGGVLRGIDAVARHAIVGGIPFAKVQAAGLIDEAPEVQGPDIVDPLGGRARIDDDQLAPRVVVMAEGI